MLRNVHISLLFGMALAFGMTTGCASKKTTPASATDASSGSDSGSANETDVSSAGGKVSLSSLPVVYFGFNEYSIRAEDRDNLKGAAAAIKAGKAKVTVEGHCDERGSTEYNLALGEKRAQSVKSYLVKLGVSAANLSSISYGEERPASQGSSEDNWTKNRRGELVVNR